jgi:hypothetical protein
VWYCSLRDRCCRCCASAKDSRRHAAGNQPFDLQNALTPAEVYPQLATWTENARTLYYAFTLIDYAFPFFAGLFIAATAAFALRVSLPTVVCSADQAKSAARVHARNRIRLAGKHRCAGRDQSLPRPNCAGLPIVLVLAKQAETRLRHERDRPRCCCCCSTPRATGWPQDFASGADSSAGGTLRRTVLQTQRQHRHQRHHATDEQEALHEAPGIIRSK